MSKRNRSGAIWRAVCSTIDNCLAIFTSSARRFANKNSSLAEVFQAWGRVEPLECRTYLSGIPYISGPLRAEAGQAYTLHLVNNSFSFSSWEIDWGDGTTSDPDQVNVSHTATFATHTFTSAPSHFEIKAWVEGASSSLPTYSLGLNFDYGTMGQVAINDADVLSTYAFQNPMGIEANGDVVALIYGNSGYPSGTLGFALERFDPNGSLDTTFGSSGFVQLPSTPAYSWACLTVSGDGDVVVAGTLRDSGVFGDYSASLVAELYKQSGSTGTLVTYGTNESFEDMSYMLVMDVAYADDEIAVVAGDSTTTVGSGGCLAVFNTADQSEWEQLVDRSGDNYYSNEYVKVAIDPGDGAVTMTRAVLYYGYSSTNYIAEYNYGHPVVDELQWSSGGGAIAYNFIRPGVYDPIVAIQPSGKILLGGVNLQQFLPDGSPDSNFGLGGYEPIPFSQILQIVPLSNDQSLVLAQDSLGNDYLALYNPDGTLDKNFGISGTFGGAIANSYASQASAAQLSDGDFEVASIEGDTVDIAQVYNSNAVQVVGPPNVSITNPPAATVGNPLTINAAVTSGGQPSDQLTYNWTATFNTTTTSYTTSGPDLTFTPNTNGSGWVYLTVTDSTLSNSTQTFQTTASNSFSVGTLAFQMTGPDSAFEGSTLDYLAIGTDSSSATWKVIHNGTTSSFTGSATLDYTPTSTGTYIIQATQGSPGTQTATLTLTVNYTAPTVSIVGPSIGFEGQALTFSSNVAEANGLNDPLAYDWTLYEANGTTSISVSANNTMSTFVVPGFTVGTAATNGTTFEVSLTVTDYHDSTTKSVTQTSDFVIMPASLGDPGSTPFQWATAQIPPPQIDGGAFGPIPDRVVNSVAVEANGKIVMAGNLNGYDGFGSGGYLAQFNSDMTPDSSFGPNHTGIMTTDLGSIDGFDSGGWSIYSGVIYNIAINPNNQDIVVVGGVLTSDDSNMSPWVAEYLSSAELYDGTLYPAGSPDPQFNGGTAYYMTISDGGGLADALAFDGDDILVGGTQATSVSGGGHVNDFLLFALTATGTAAGMLDTSFGDGGVAEEPWVEGHGVSDWDFGLISPNQYFGTDQFPAAITTLVVIDDPEHSDNGDILAGGNGVYLSDSEPVTGIELVRWTSSGNLDTANFGYNNSGAVFTTSEALTDASSEPVGLSSLEPLSDGAVLVAALINVSVGYPDVDDVGTLAFAQYDSSGNLDDSYGSGGIENTEIYYHPPPLAIFELWAERANQTSIFLPNGDLALDSNPNSDNEPSTVQFINPNTGGIDSTFGNNGYFVPTMPDSMSDDCGVLSATSQALFIGGATVNDPIGDDVLGDDDINVVDEPSLIRFNLSTSSSKAKHVAATSTPNGGISLSWIDNGAADGYEIERSTSSSFTSPVILAFVGKNQTSYTDPQYINTTLNLSPNNTYYYDVVAITTLSNGSLTGVLSCTASAVTFPASTATYTLVDDFDVPINGGTVTSTSLNTDSNYIIVVTDPTSGSVTSEPVTLADGYGADAEEWYSMSTSSSANTGTALDGDPFGLAINGTIPSWVSVSTGNHSYASDYVGENAALDFAFDGTLVSGTSQMSPTLQDEDQYLRVYIYGTGSNTATGTAGPAMLITSPATNGNGQPPTISADTPIDVESLDSTGASAPWSLLLISSNTGSTVTLTTGSYPAGNEPFGGSPVTTLDPALYSNGVYNLELKNSSGVFESLPVNLQSIVETPGNLTVSATDITLNTPAGVSLPVTRVYDSDDAGDSGDFGNGWNLNLLDSQLHVTSSPDTFDPTQTTPVMQAGDLVSMTVPDGGQFNFEFDPQVMQADWTYGASPSTVAYEPAFISLDGSGATLSVVQPQWSPFLSGHVPFNTYDEGSFISPYTLVGSNQYYDPQWGLSPSTIDLEYDAADDEFLDYTRFVYTSISDSPNYSGYENVTADAGFYPARDILGINEENQLTSGVEYQLTTPDGTSYIIDPTTGDILSATSASGTPIYTLDPNGNLVSDYTYASTAAGANFNDGQVLLNIQWSGTPGASRIESIQVPGQNSISYTYNNTSSTYTLQTATNQFGNQTNYTYNTSALLTSATNSGGTVVLQAQYDATTDELTSVTNRSGVYVPISTILDAGQMSITTNVSSSGSITETIYDQYGNPVRAIAPTLSEDSSGNWILTGYVVNTVDRAYGVAEVGYPAPGAGSIATLQSITTYAPIQITGTDPDLVRFSEQPDPSTQIQQTVYVSDGEFIGQVQSTATAIDFAGGTQTVTNSNFQVVDSETGEIKPTKVVTTISNESTGNTPIVQSAVDSFYNFEFNGDGIPTSITEYSITELGPDPSESGSVMGDGTEENLSFNDYGEITTATQYNVSVVISANGTVSSVPSRTTEKTDIYYTYSFTPSDTALAPPGAVTGKVESTTDAAGQETFYAYTQNGQTAMTYTQKVVGTLTFWVGSTNDYNNKDQLVDTYDATYNNNTLTLGVVNTVDNGYGNPIVNTAMNSVYEGSYYLAAHNDYNSLGQIADSVDQYSGTTTYTYNNNGQVILTVYPDSSEQETVYDSNGWMTWQTNKFVPGETTAVATNTNYNDLGQVVSTQEYENTAIAISSPQGTFTLGQAPTGAMTDFTSNVTSTGTMVTSTSGGTTLYAATTNYYDNEGQVVETDSASGLRTGTIYYPNGQVAYTGILSSSAPNGTDAYPGTPWYDSLPTTSAPVPTNYFTSNGYTSSAYDQYDSSLGLFYTQNTDQNGNSTETYTDSEGRTVRTVYPDGSFTETLYSWGTTAVSEDEEGDSISAPTGWAGIPSTSGENGSETVEIAQRREGDPIVPTYDVYDWSGNLVDVYDPAVPEPSDPSDLVNPLWKYTYDSAGNETTQIGPQGSDTTTFTYDQNGNELSRILPDGQTEHYTYNQFGQELAHIDFDGNTATYTYYNSYGSGDYTGSLESVVYTGSGKTTQTVSYTYTSTGQLYTVADASGTTTYTYDAFGNQTVVASPEGTITYSFDPATGNLTDTSTSKTDTEYTYDDLGQLTGVTVDKLNDNTLTGTAILVTTYTYDGVGNQISETLPNGVTTSLTYDALNRLTGLVETNASGTLLFSQQYTFYPDGTRASVMETQRQTDGTTDTTLTDWTYDNLDRLTSETVYDSLPDTISIPDAYNIYGADGDEGGYLNLTADGSGYYVSEGDTAEGILSGSETGLLMLDPALAAPVIDANGTTSDADWLVWSEAALTGDIDMFSVALSGGTFTADGIIGNGDLPSPPSFSFGATEEYSDTYSYDLDSNRTEEDIDGGSTTYGGSSIDYTYNGNDELTTQTTTQYNTSGPVQTSQTTYTYDANGSETKDITAAANGTSTTYTTNSYTFDVRNRMVTYALNGTNQATYLYDDAGDRVQETSGGNTTFFLTNTNNPTGFDQPMEVWTSSNGSLSSAALNTTYLIGNRVFAQVNSSGAVTYLLVDGHESTRLLTNATGTVTGVINYDAFGDMTSSSGSPSTIFMFAGDAVFDPVSGMYFNGDGIRERRPGQPDFIETDDQGYGDNTDPITLNAEIYGDGNPVNNNDPSGHYAGTYVDGNYVQTIVAAAEAYSASDDALAIEIGDNDSNAIISAQTAVSSVVAPTLASISFSVTATTNPFGRGSGAAVADLLFKMEDAALSVPAYIVSTVITAAFQALLVYPVNYIFGTKIDNVFTAVQNEWKNYFGEGWNEFKEDLKELL
jgi:YD repeat-containing protein